MIHPTGHKRYPTLHPPVVVKRTRFTPQTYIGNVQAEPLQRPRARTSLSELPTQVQHRVGQTSLRSCYRHVYVDALNVIVRSRRRDRLK